MKITIESTSLIVNASGIDCRVWVGQTQSGVQVQALIPRIAALATEDLRQFEAELQEQQAPMPKDMAFPLSMIL